MKLNAPPPPTNNLSESAVAEAPPPTPSESEWPRWYTPADGLLAVLAIALAFLLASFAARNADVWLHLAVGRLLAQGQYAFGIDPFSFATVGRYWANPAWLFDLLEYQIYSRLGGVALVVLKALSLAGAAGLLLSIRRRGQSMWPWVLVLVLALLAAAPKMLLSPISASMVCMALLLFLLFRIPSPAGSWKLPALLGVLFALWSNLDEWFFLGPLVIAALLVGSAIQTWRKAHESDDPNPPLGASPATSTLAKSLFIGLLACMVNPHHFHVWQLPIEVTHSTAMANEPLFQRQILLSPLDGDYSDLARNGRNVNGAAYLILFVGGGLVLGLGVGRLRLGHLLLWLAFALLSLRTVSAIPFFALVSVPLLAGQLNSFTQRLVRASLPESRVPMWLFAGTFGRGLGLVLMCVLIVLAWPGWLHPTQDYDSDTPRVAWGIIPDPSMRKTAEQIQAWRESGALTPQDRGVLLSTQLGNYCAWFAPAEKVFVNTRYGFHEPELPTYTRLRSNVGTRPDSSAQPNMAEVAKITQKYDISYLGLYEAGRSLGLSVARLLKDEDHWSLWSLGGRSAILGWRPSPEQSRPSFDGLRLNPTVLAFGTNAGLRNVPSTDLYRPQTLLDDLFPPATAAASEADEAIHWIDYKDDLALRGRQVKGVALLFANTGKPFDPLITQLVAPSIANTHPADEAVLGLLALRGARQAIAANPDHPDGYFALVRAISEPTLMIDEPTRRATMAFAMQEALRLVPPPGTQQPRGLAFSPISLAGALATVLEENSRLNLAEQNPEFASFLGAQQVRSLSSVRQFLSLAIQYVSAELASTGPNAELAAERDRWVDALKKLEKELQDINGQFEDFRAGNPRVRDGYFYARRLGLNEKALQLLQEADLRKEFGKDWPLVVVQQVALELYLGRVREAGQHLAVLDQAIREGELTHPELRIVTRKLALMLANILGNYRGAASLLESLRSENIGIPEAILKPYIPLGDFNIAIPLFQAGPPLGLSGALLAGFQRTFILINSLRLRRQVEADYHFDLGLLALYDGDNARAREQFQKVNPLPPPGWGLPAPRQAGFARFFLERMEMAAQERPR